MNIKNQIRLSVIISLILVVVISASIIVSFQNMQELRDQEALAADVVRGGYELTYLSNDYLINGEPRARLQWEERYSSLQPIIGELKPGNVQEAQSLVIIRDYNEKTGKLFEEIPEPGTLSAGATLFPASYQQVMWSRINVQSQGMIYEAWRLRHLYNDDVSNARFWNNILVVVLMVLMLIIIGVNYLLISRRLVRSIRDVDAGSKAFATGNLDYRIPLQGTDEIGNIGAGLNAMAARLKTITASRDELDREVDQRRKAEESLTLKNTDLKAAFEEIAANEEELKANLDELVHSQRALEESERKYRNLYQYAQVGLFETSFKDATVVACNQRYATLAGFSSIEEAIGEDIIHLYVNADDRTEVERILREQGSIENHTLRLRNQSTGKIFWGQFSARFDFEREIAEGSIIDITAQKEAEDRIRETNEYLHKLIDFANAPIVIWNPDYTITRFNHAFEHLTGRTEQEVLGQPLETLFPETGRDAALALIKQTLEGERWESVKIPVIGADGAPHTLLWNSANILSAEAELISTIAHGIDITERERAEERLKESERAISDIVEKLNEAQQITMIGSWEWNLVTNRVWWSDETYRIFGITPQDFVPGFEANGRFIHPDDLEKYNSSFEHSFRTGESLDLDIRLVTRDGVLKYCHAKGKIIYDDAGKPSRFVGTMSDITGRRQAEAELAAAQQQYRELFDNVSIGILRSTPGPEGSLIEANPAALRIFEADSREQLLAVRPSDLYLDHDERRRISEEIVAKGTITSMEVRYKTLKGRAFWGSITSSKKVSDNGQVYFDNTIEDITDRKDIEVALRESERKFRETVKTLDEGYYSCTPDGILLEHNVAFNRILGIDADRDLKGTPLPGFWQNPDDRTPYVEELLAKGFVQNFTIHAKKTSGEKIVVLASAHLARDEAGLVQRIEGTFTDYTELKRAENELKASEEKFSTAFKTSPYAITITRISDGHFIEVNDAFTPITGFTREDAIAGSSIGLNLWVDTEDRKRIISALLDGRSVNGEEFLFRRKNGEIMTGLFSARIISLTNEPCILSSISDITERKRAEEALRESEERYREFFTTSRDLVFITTPQGQWVDFNETALEMFGYGSRAELMALPLSQLYVLSEERDVLLAMIEREGSVKEYPVRLRKKGGSVIDALITAVPLKNPDGLIHAFVGSIRDITEQKRAEEKIATSETRYRRLFEAAKDGILILNRDTGEIIDANPFIETLLGYAPKDLLGKHLWDLGLFNDWLLSKVAFEELQTKEYVRYEDLPLETKDGQRIEVEFVSNVYPVDPVTSVIQCNIRDITDRKKAEDALRETTDYLRNLLDSANAPIIVWDPQFRITRFNHAFERLTGRIEQEVAGQHLSLLFPVLSRETSLEQIEKTLAGERWEIVEIPILHVSGETRIVLWNSANIVDPKGAVISTIAQGQDITDRKLTEVQREMLIAELEQKNAELERYTYTVSHDLKSPLITIRGFAGLLEDDVLKGDPLQLKKDIHRITEAAETMQMLLADLLELSRIGRIVTPPEKTGFGTIVHEAVELLAGPLAERGVTVEIAPDLPEVNVDHARIREVMVNLIENAIKFLDDQKDPVIRIGVDDTGETPVFFVQDNGIGINPRYLERIFNLFEKLDVSVQGTGIGLTIVRRIIEVHGGKCWAESDGPGKGTTFRFTLPGVPADRDTKGP